MLSLASRAEAVDEAAARRHFELATAAFTRGLYDDAVHEYLLAYKATNDASLLYNVAQSHRLAGHHSAALQYYKMYLQNTPDASDRKEVNKQIKEMEDKLERLRNPTVVAPPPQMYPEPVHPDSVQPTPEPSPPPAAVTTQDTGGPSGNGRGKLIGGIVIGVVGLGLAATGIAFGVLAQNAGDQLTTANHNGQPFDPAKESTGKSDQILEGVFIGIGAAAAVTGVVLIAIGAHERRAAHGFALTPSFSPSGAGASLSVGF